MSTEIPEVPRYECWIDEGLVPSEYGTMCLRALVQSINTSTDIETLDPNTDIRLRMYGWGGVKSSSQSIRCDVGGCEAKVAMTPELSQLLSEKA